MSFSGSSVSCADRAQTPLLNPQWSSVIRAGPALPWAQPLSGTRVRDKPVPVHHRNYCQHNVAVTFQRGGDAVKGDTDPYTHHRHLWGTLRYTDLDLNPRKATAGTVPNLWLLNHRTHSLLALGNVSSRLWPTCANCRRSHSLHFWTPTRTVIVSYFSFIFPLHFFLHIFHFITRTFERCIKFYFWNKVINK